MTDISKFLNPAVIEILRSLSTENQPIYLVGGAVRDMLLNRPVHDLDFALPEGAQQVARRVAGHLGGAFFMLDSDRDTARVICRQGDEERLVLDFAIFRGADLEGDLRGRDFTINAMALDVMRPDQVIDPLGGAIDLYDKRLRVCSPTSLSDDPIRILRGIRQSVHFRMRIEPETFRQMNSFVGGLSHTAIERKRDELFRILDGSRIASGIRILDKVGALAFVLPELTSMKKNVHELTTGFEHNLAIVQELEKLFAVLVGQFNEEESSNLTHGLAVLILGCFRQQFIEHFSIRFTPDRSRRALLMLSALLRRLDDGPVALKQSEEKPSLKSDRGLRPKASEKRKQGLALSQDEAHYVKMIADNCQLIHQFRERGNPLTRRDIYRYYQKMGSAGVDLALISLADLLAKYRSAVTQAIWKEELETCKELLDAWWNQAAVIVNPPRLVTGEDAMNLLDIHRGPVIGKLLEAVREEQAAGIVQTREQALEFARHWIDESDHDPRETDDPFEL